MIAIQNARLFNETQGGARAADRHRRSAGGDQQLGRRHPAGVREDPRKLPAAVRVHRSLGADGRRAVAGSCRCASAARAGARFEKSCPMPLETVGDRRSDARAPRDAAIRTRCTASGVPDVIRRMAAKIGNFSVVVAPMLWQGRGIGALFVVRGQPQAVQRQGGRAARDLRRPGGDRDPERAPVQARPRRRAPRPRRRTRRRARSWRR